MFFYREVHISHISSRFSLYSSSQNDESKNMNMTNSPERGMKGSVKCSTLEDKVLGYKSLYITYEYEIINGNTDKERREKYLKSRKKFISSRCCDCCIEEHEFANRTERSILCEKKIQKSVERIKKLISNGICVSVVGKDITNIAGYFGDSLEDKLSMCFEDNTITFNQEMCLYSMLVLEKSEYPWRKKI